MNFYRDRLKFVFETARPRAYIHGMMHHLVDAYRECSNYPAVTIGPTAGLTY